MIPEVSIIVPLYKTENYMKKCVDSILRQSLQNIEVILVNDGSPDKCGEIADEYAKIDNRVKVIHSENMGPSHARNLGIKQASGVFIGFVDSDDWIEEDMYKNLYTAANNNNCDAVICSITIDDSRSYESTVINNPLSEGIHNRDNITQYIILPMIGPKEQRIFSTPTHMLGSACRNIFSRKLIVENNILFPEDISYAEDLLFCFNCYMKCSSLYVLNQPYYHYLYDNSASSLTRGYRENLFDTLLSVHDSLDYQIKLNKLLKTYQSRLDARILDSAQKAIANIFKRDNKDLFYKKMSDIYSIITNKKVRTAFKRLEIKQLRLKDRMVFSFIRYKLTILLYLYFFTRIRIQNRRLKITAKRKLPTYYM